MMTINENKKLSRNKKRRIERKNKLNDNMKLLLNKIKSEKKKKNKDIIKIKQLEILLVRIKYTDKPHKLESALKDKKKFKLLIKIYTKLKMKLY